MRRVRFLPLTLGALLLGASLAPASVAAQEPPWTVVASGLDNPRGLAFAPNGALYVAEAGRGGDEFCISGPDGEESCLGRSGSVTRIWRGAQRRVLTGLPSIAGEDGTAIAGPVDVSFQGVGNAYVVTGGVGDPRALEAPGVPSYARALLGKLLRSAPNGRARVVADPTAFEMANDPDGDLPGSEGLDSNPYAVLAGPAGRYVVDAGGNDLLHVSQTGLVSLVTVFPFRTAEAPPFLGLPPGTRIPLQPVPDSIARGPDGALYVGELTGFPFPVGDARVWRVAGGRPTVFRTGFTAIIDIAFGADGSLYVLEFAQAGLLGPPSSGALIRVAPNGTRTTLIDEGLIAPGGLAIRGRDAYISNCGVCVGGGTVVRFRLP